MWHDTNPGQDYTWDSSLVADGGHGGNPPVMSHLWNNRYVVLVDVDDKDGRENAGGLHEGN